MHGYFLPFVSQIPLIPKVTSVNTFSPIHFNKVVLFPYIYNALYLSKSAFHFGILLLVSGVFKITYIKLYNSMGFVKCIVSCIHPYSIIQSISQT